MIAAVARDSVIAALRASQVFNGRVFGMLAQYWRSRGRADSRIIWDFAPMAHTVILSV